MLHYDRLLPPVHGGAYENLATAKALSRLGHRVDVLIPTTDASGTTDTFLQACDTTWAASDPRWAGKFVHYAMRVAADCNVHVVEDDEAGVIEFLAQFLTANAPDAILSSESGHYPALSIDEFIAQSRVPWIYLPKTIHCQPFGPLSVRSDAVHTTLLRETALIVTPSTFAAEYFRAHGFDGAVPFYFPIYDPPHRQTRDGHHVLMINPSPWKGWKHFEALARALPAIPFRYVPGWGTTPEIERHLLSYANVERMAPTTDRDRLFAGARILLVPSVCFETLGQVTIQSLQRAVPVVSSNLGGLPESALGVAQLVKTTPNWDGKGAEANAEEDIARWLAMVSSLLTDDRACRDLADRGIAAAERFTQRLNWEALAELLKEAIRP